MYYVYIIKSKSKARYYTGCTANIKERLRRHNSGDCSWTKRYLPWKIHYLEKFQSKYDAYRREKYLKTHAGRNWIKINLGP